MAAAIHPRDPVVDRFAGLEFPVPVAGDCRETPRSTLVDGKVSFVAAVEVVMLEGCRRHAIPQQSRRVRRTGHGGNAFHDRLRRPADARRPLGIKIRIGGEGQAVQGAAVAPTGYRDVRFSGRQRKPSCKAFPGPSRRPRGIERGRIDRPGKAGTPGPRHP